MNVKAVMAVLSKKTASKVITARLLLRTGTRPFLYQERWKKNEQNALKV